ncbi:TetR/AcrR family transcriptional regulator of autoinduction and epiphytic fitness [Rhizobium sp. SG_E_25_P2]|uniref:TetR/AcrR family transcriptional regulator n=1 Tax=Rhizobium sp. SG_E_25_P2 TaxID=2879942 RepID=UPI0024750EB7|nr:TetR/AcrR family transcriptional regulator [Rhizobium sp. SG_E_25_P2]MDH6268222.1 TetR/AcrR family transcriptional regulator of autoinduction and epiphytic fitness [Rhizobium sp. SG_E_25_P2]
MFVDFIVGNSGDELQRSRRENGKGETMTLRKSETIVRSGRPSREMQNAAAERIIEAATALFASRGFAGTSMEQVASHCGAGKDTVYRRYPSKVVLFEAVVEHAHKRAVARLEDLPPMEGDALKRLQALLRELLHINMEPDLIAFKRITFSEAVVFEKNAAIPPQPDPIMSRLVHAVVEAQDARLIADGDADAIAGHLIHCLVALPTSSAMMGSGNFDTKEAIDTHFDRTWGWLLKGVAPQIKS